jgi:hypothetical protein
MDELCALAAATGELYFPVQETGKLERKWNTILVLQKKKEPRLL